jgi:hypothetical protein
LVHFAQILTFDFIVKKDAYQALHPENHEATEDSIKNVTITNVLLDQYCKDLHKDCYV